MNGAKGGESIGKKLEVGKIDKWQKASKSKQEVMSCRCNTIAK